jgi:DNA-binding NtrC family response regulator
LGERYEGEREEGRIDLVISEVQFKDKTQGLALLRELRAINGNLNAVLVSGYPDDAAKMRQAGEAFLCKPLRQQELMETVAELLKSGPTR